MKKVTILIVFLAVFGGFFGLNKALANEAPIWERVANKAVFVNDELVFRVYAYDPDDDEIILSAVNLPAGAVFNQRSRYFSWTPATGQAGRYNIILRAFDGISSSDLNVLVNVTDIQNPPPVLNPPPPPTGPTPTGPPNFLEFVPPLRAKEGQLYTYTARASDEWGSSITYRFISSPQGMTITPSLGVIVWVPNFTQGRVEPYEVVLGAANSRFENTLSFKIFVEDTPQTVQSGPIVQGNGNGKKVSPPPAVEALAISNLKVEKDNADIVISWKTNFVSRGRVIYDTESQADKKSDFNYENATPEPSADKAAKEHVVRLSDGDLEPSTKYYFRAVAKKNGETAVSEEMIFETESREGLGLLASLGNFLSNVWFWVVIIFIVIFVVFKLILGKKH